MKPTNLSHPRAWARVAVPAALLALGACGGSSGPGPTPVTPPPTPAVAITATPAGNLVLHPSLDTRFTFALETPIRLQETAGGSADWNFVRMQVFLRGREIERYELGATSIASQGYTKITPNSNNVRTPILRMNSDDFDRIDLVLGFADLKDARQFTVNVTGFPDVTVSFTPVSLPEDGDGTTPDGN